MRCLHRLSLETKGAIFAAAFYAFIAANPAAAYQWNATATVDSSTMTTNQLCYWGGKTLECSATNPTIASGQVGIGTTSFSQALTVAGNIDITGTGLGFLSEIANDGSTGTTANKLAKLTTAGAAIIAATTDTDGMVGIVSGNAGTTGNAQVAVNGQASCVFDGATTAGDFVSISTTTAGDCHDAGATRSTSSQTIGRVLSTNGSGGTYAVELVLNGSASASGAATGSGTTSYVARWTPNGNTLGIGTLYDNGTDVGIGTTSPTNPLSIVTASGIYGLVISNSTVSLDFSYNQIKSVNGPLYLNNSSAGNVSIAGGGGLVGIGTTTPTNLLSLSGAAAQTFWMERGTAAGNGLTVQAGGGLSGGTNENGGTLTLASGISTGTGSSGINFNVYGAGITGTADNAATTKMSITSLGVGIGTTAPFGYLDLEGVGGGGVFLQINGNNTSTNNAIQTKGAVLFDAGASSITPLSIYGRGGQSVPVFEVGATSASPGGYLTVGSTGNIGIGSTVPSATLDVNGFIVADGGSTITSNPPTTGYNDAGWKIGLYSNSYALGIAQDTLAAKVAPTGWFSIFGNLPANGATASTPDTNSVVSFSGGGNGLFSGAVGIGTSSIIAGAALDLSNNTTTSNSSVILPVGTTGTRPVGVNGMIRYNTALTPPALEAYVNGGWESLQTSGTTSGVLGVANGGTGDSTLTAHGVVVGEGTTAAAVTAAGAIDTVLVGNGSSSDPTFSASPTLSGTITDLQSIGATSTDGLVLQNTAAAANNAQQYSPRIHFSGRGWETGTSASQAVDMIEELQPQQGTANPTGNLTWSGSVNGGSYSPLMALTSAGSLGIGTTAPAFPLEVAGSAAVTTLYGRTQTQNANDTLYLGSNAYQNFFIDQPGAGSIIVGYNTPKVAAGTPRFQVVNNSSGKTVMFEVVSAGSSSGTNYQYFYGNLGVGVFSPSDMLDVNGAIGLTATTATAPTNGIYSPSTNNLALTTNGTAAVTVTSSQQVGIGTASPNDKLDVNGAVKVAGTGSEGCTTATMGQMRFNPTYNYMEICQ